MKKYDHGLRKNLYALGISAILFILCILGWEFAKHSLPILIIAVVGIILLSAAATTYDFFHGPIFEKDLTGFAPQSAPIALSSALSGWVASRTFITENVGSRLEENAIILLIGEIIVVVSIFNFSEGVYPLKDVPDKEKPVYRNARLRLTLNLMGVHGILAFIIGYISAESTI